MKRKIILTAALALSIVLVSLMSSDSTLKAEPPQRFTFDTGIVTLGANQTLRVVSVDGELEGGIYGEVIKRFEYQQTGCEAGICKLAVASQTTSPLIRFAQNEAASIETPNGGSRRIMIVTDNRNLRVNAIVFDTSTQRVHATMELEWIVLN